MADSPNPRHLCEVCFIHHGAFCPSAVDPAVNDWRLRAYHNGLGGVDNRGLADALLNLAERGTITVSYGVVAALVEAAGRIDGDAYLAWMKKIDDAEAVASVPCLSFS